MRNKKILITGPESSGKTTLAKNLAAHFETVFVAEYARQYLEARAGKYQYEDLWNIAQGQLALENKLLHTMPAGSRPAIIDTDLTVIKIWSEIVYGKCDNRILTGISKSEYDHILLCYPDLPWEFDSLREYPDESVRLRHFNHYLWVVNFQHMPFSVIKGTGNDRHLSAINAVQYLFDQF